MKLTATAFALITAATAIGCHNDSDASSKQADPAVAADNTGKNERDRESDALTPGDQGGSEADRKITQEIRRSIIKDDGMSTSGKNVKIITNDGTVTLRGPVKTPAEKSDIARLAKSVQGVKQLDNQIEVATN